MKIIEIKNLYVSYDISEKREYILEDISVNARRGELIGLIGVNGSGKSTLLRIISRLQKYDKGNIFIEGRDIKDYTKKESAKKISFVSSDIINTKYLKVYDTVALGRFPHFNFSGSLTGKDKDIIDNALKITNTEKFKTKNLSEISDGERQRVMTARALAQDTDIILLDEPASFLDTENKFFLYKILSDVVKERDKTVVFSTHDLNIAFKYCDKVWFIKDKKIFEGAPEDLFLQNILQNMFSDKGIKFNPDTFEFYAETKKNIPVNIICNANLEKEKTALINAVRRKGFYPSDKNTDIKIEITKKNSYKIFTGKYSFETDNIYKLLNFVKCNKININHKS